MVDWRDEALVALNTQEALDKFWARKSVRDGYFTPMRLSYYDRVASYLELSIDDMDDPIKVCDVGCGPGYMLAALSRHYPERHFVLHGVDWSRSAIRWAREVCPDATYHVANITHGLDIHDVDIVLSLQTLEYIVEWRQALDNMMAMLRRGGELVITVPDGRYDSWEGHVNRWTADDLLTLLKPYGCRLVWQFTSTQPMILAHMIKV
jgi:2-polyprenyl-3-methyl-5-hydroxy-6-metoxy-1,4-benzoquinol methylase